jgi:tape measure domain-containing protein
MASNLGTVFVELSLDDKVYKQRLSETLTSTEATAKGLETSWRALGTKSDAYFDAQRRSAENAYSLIVKSGKFSAEEIIRAEEAKNAKIKALNEQQYGHQVTLQDKLQKNWLSVTTAIAAAYGALAGGKQLIDAALAMDRINYAMASSVGDADKAAREYQYVREEAQRLGLGLNETALAYSKFAASARGTSLEGEQTRKVFSSVAEAATALRLPTEQTSGIFLALSQMMSKGKVQAEELRGQLGERLPGAFNLAAQSMGVTTAELDEMLKKGEVTAADMLPKLAVVLHETYGGAATEAAQGGQAAINRFNNEMFLTKVVMGESILPVFTDFLGIVQKTTPYITAFIGGIQMSAVEVFGWIDKVDAVLTHASKYTDPTQWGIISTSDLKKRLKEIDGNVEETKKDIVKNIDKVKSSSISAADKAAQAVINAERKKQEASTKASDASTKAAEAAAKRQEAAEKQLAQELEKTLADRKKYEGTYYEWKAAEIEVGLNKYKEAGVAEEKIAELRKEKLINLNDEIFKQYKKTLQDWEADTKKKQEAMLAEEEKAEKEALDRAERQRTATKDLYKDLEAYSGDYYAVEKALLDSRAQAYELLLIDEMTSAEDAAKYEVAIAAWKANELKKLDIERGKSSDEFFAGMRSRIDEISMKQTKWGQVGYDTFKAMTEGMSSTFSTVFEDAYKGQLQSIGDYSTMIWDKVRAKYFDMVAQMIAEKIVLSFGTTWAEGGAAVLSTINKVLGLADSLDLGQYVGVNFAQGGIVQGVAAYPGNDERNDRVPAWLSPGEYIIPRTAVNADTREILDYIRSFGKAPGYALGGWVTRYNEYGEPVKEWQRGDEMAWVYNPEYTAGLTPYTTQKYLEPNDLIVTNPFHMRPMQGPDEPYKLGNETPYYVFALNVALGKYPDGYYRIDYQRPGNVDSWVYQVASNKIVGSRLEQWGSGLSSSGGMFDFLQKINPVSYIAGVLEKNKPSPEIESLVRMATVALIANVGAQAVGALIGATGAGTGGMTGAGGVYGSPDELFAAAGQIGGSSFASAAEVAAAASAAGAAETGLLLSQAAQQIVKYALKSMMTMPASVVSAAYGGASKLGISLTGISGLEILAMLSDLNGIIGMGGYIPSARSGIDYIPRDNYLVNTHQGEAVLTKEENQQRLTGKGGGNVTYNFNLYATVADKKTMNEFAEQIYPRLEKLRAWGH